MYEETKVDFTTRDSRFYRVNEQKKDWEANVKKENQEPPKSSNNNQVLYF